MDRMRIAFVGSGAVDHHVRDARIVVESDSFFCVQYARDSSSYLSLEPVVPGAKINVPVLPAAPLALADGVPGGGALNSLSAFAELVPGAEYRYLDSGERDEVLAARCAELGAESRFMGLYPTPYNAVIGMGRRDRVILKSIACRTSRLNADSAAEFESLAGFDAVVMNSARPVSVASQVVNMQAWAGFRLHAAITHSLPAGFVVRTVLPVATTVFANWDEMDVLANSPFERTVKGAADLLRWLKHVAPLATVFVTMGAKGALVSLIGSDDVVRVCLRPGVARAVSTCVAAAPSGVCGCGDAFGAGAVAAMETGRSWLVEPAGCVSAVYWALSGCAAALRHLGYSRPLTPSDFDVRRVGLCSSELPNQAGAYSLKPRLV